MNTFDVNRNYTGVECCIRKYSKSNYCDDENMWIECYIEYVCKKKLESTKPPGVYKEH